MFYLNQNRCQVLETLSTDPVTHQVLELLPAQNQLKLFSIQLRLVLNLPKCSPELTSATRWFYLDSGSEDVYNIKGTGGVLGLSPPKTTHRTISGHQGAQYPEM